MARYFFHLFNDIECRDDEGTVLPDLAAARDHAINDARAIIATEVRDKGEITLSHWIEVDDERGNVVMIVKFDEAVKINP